MMENISEEASLFLKKCDVLEIFEKFSNFVFHEKNITPHINIDLSKYENALQQHQFFADGKFHFLFALKLFYNSQDTETVLNLYIEEQRNLLHSSIISNDCFEKILSKLFDWFFHDIHEIFDRLYSHQVYTDEYIQNEDVVFYLFEFCYKSDVYTDKYNFDVLDIRRQLFNRIETLTLNFYQNYIFFKKNIKSLFIETLKFNYEIKDFSERIVKMKEVDFRRHFITEFYFNVEHFLSEIKRHFNISTTDSHNKQAILKDVMTHFNINDKIDLEVFFNSVNKKCNETRDIVKNLYAGKGSKTLTLFNALLINRRNSLHSNGLSSKNEQKTTIGKIVFEKVNKGDFINSMSLVHIIVLSLFELKVLELIIDETYKIEPGIIEDKYMKEYQQFIENL